MVPGYCSEITNEKLLVNHAKRCLKTNSRGVWATIGLAAPVSDIGLNQPAIPARKKKDRRRPELPVELKVENPLLGGRMLLHRLQRVPLLRRAPRHRHDQPESTQHTDLKASGETSAHRGSSKLIAISENSLVNNEIAVPGATGCGIPACSPRSLWLAGHNWRPRAQTDPPRHA